MNTFEEQTLSAMSIETADDYERRIVNGCKPFTRTVVNICGQLLHIKVGIELRIVSDPISDPVIRAYFERSPHILASHLESEVKKQKSGSTDREGHSWESAVFPLVTEFLNTNLGTNLEFIPKANKRSEEQIKLRTQESREIIKLMEILANSAQLTSQLVKTSSTQINSFLLSRAGSDYERNSLLLRSSDHTVLALSNFEKKVRQQMELA